MEQSVPSTDLMYHPLYINGEWCDAQSERTFTVYEAATGEPMATVASASPADIDRAVQSARTAFDHGPWPHTPPDARARILHDIADLLEEHTDELTELEARDIGVPLRKTMYLDIPFGIEIIRTCAELARKHPYEPLPWIDMPSLSWNFVWREPVGVCAQIIPWNYAFPMACWKIGPALATGNTIVFKPSSLAPLTSIAMIRIIAESGLLPRGTINLITGPGGEVGEYLVAHPKVDKVAFTGSTDVGRKVMTLAAQGVKRLTLELGGKSPSLIMPDADLDIVTDGVLWGAFYHSGQLCEAGTRCFVHASQYDEVIERLVNRVGVMRLGDPMDLATDLGPVISQKQRTQIERYIELGLTEGAKLVCGGKRPQGPLFDRGPYIEPTIFADVKNGSRLAQEEIFGPVLSVIRYESINEAIAMANDTIYGLAASIWSRDIQGAIQAAQRLRAGTVWINDHHLLNANAPFGGYKQSGFGREMSSYGLHEYTEEKHIHVDLMQKRQGKLWWDALLPE